MERGHLLSVGGTGVVALLTGCLGGDGNEGGTGERAMTDGGTDEGGLTATVQTSEGDIKLELYDKRAPRTVENFVGLATGEKV